MVALAVVENQERRHTEINRAHKTHNPKSRCGNLSNTYTKPPKSPFHLSTDSCLQSDNGVSTSNNPVQQYLYSILIVALALSRIIPSRKSHNLVLSLRPPCSCPLPPTFQGNGRGHGKLLPRLLVGAHYGELAIWRAELSFEYYSSWKI